MLCVWAALQRSLCALRRAERWTRSHGLRGKDGRMSTHHFHRFHGIQPTIPALSHSPGPRFRRRLQGRYIPGGLSESGSTHPSRPSAPYADAGRRPPRHPHAGGPRRAAPRALGSKRNCRWARPLGPARLHRRPPNARLAHAGIVDGRPVTVGEPCAGQERPFGLKDLLGPYVNSCGDPFAGRPRVETKTRGGESPPPRARRGGPVRAPAHGVHHTLYSQQNIRCIQQNTRYILNRSQGLLGHPRP